MDCLRLERFGTGKNHVCAACDSRVPNLVYERRITTSIHDDEISWTLPVRYKQMIDARDSLDLGSKLREKHCHECCRVVILFDQQHALALFRSGDLAHVSFSFKRPNAPLPCDHRCQREHSNESDDPKTQSQCWGREHLCHPREIDGGKERK